MFSDLCVELLQEIASEAAATGQRELRAVSRQLRYAIDPLFFAATALMLDLDQHLDGSASQLEVLAGGPTGWCRSRKLIIRSLSHKKDDGIQMERIFKSLQPALQSLTSLRAVHWTLNDGDAQWVQILVADILNTHAHVDELYIITRIYDHTQWDPFTCMGPISNLRILSVERTQRSWEPHLPSWLRYVIARSPHLESLRAPHLTPEICETLQNAHIRLTDISTNADDALLRYLASYSGLERLEIADIYNQHGEFLFGSVIPRHKASLVALSCPGYTEGTCSFRRANIALVSELRNLETLEMTVNAEDMAPECGNMRDIVELFLEMASDMPALRNMAILAAISMYGGGCGNAVERHVRWVQTRIGKTVDTFGQARGSLAVSHLIETHHRRVKILREGRLFG
ncbi:hypothetical protein C8R44DRAFT_984249 [Mycena epipterygia]|nr:hypothetical protein C8R44DRAFT_984249 [Mycena epipterygia]